MRSSVHPRASGERRPASSARRSAAGSSPRERGTLGQRSGPCPSIRFIPARAGNARRTCRTTRREPVHPRASGERAIAPLCHFLQSGSSPRERGTHQGAADRGRRSRFIPARAGNAAAPTRIPRRTPVHPRASGERSLRSRTCAGLPGSSPRERGTRNRHQRRDGDHRFIPARAGNAGEAHRAAAGSPVHPRASGERFISTVRWTKMSGSSPRERGTPRWRRWRSWFRRFIPARAGNAHIDKPVAVKLPVHPRASGERGSACRGRPGSSGSSPRERGTRLGDSLQPRSQRFIPARAGNARRARP